ncbi:MAG: HU family DNA-binding protein [Acidobacteria bacterium]|nr:HU family DNA-binding protein [Acidobacteriota bacterium]
MAGKAEYVNRIAELTGYPKTHVAQCYEKIFELIAESLAQGEKVSVAGFGTFQVSERAARQGRNPATGETITIAASKTVRFKPAKNLKESL